MNSLLLRSLSEIAELIRKRKISPVELLRGVLEEADKTGRYLNCFITLASERALERAETLERALQRGRYLGPLHGVPISLKDNIATSGVRTTGGSLALGEWIPTQHATVAVRLEAAGAILFAKTNLYEFAYGAPHPHHGPVRNPWKPDYDSGGSSSGSAASIPAGLGCASIGTDTGGSIRVPASFCGAVGVKATYGRVSRTGIIPVSYSLDCVGPITRTVKDAALVLQTISGHDDHDPTTSTGQVPDYTIDIEAGVKGVRLGTPSDEALAFCTSAVREAFERVRDLLKKAGAKIYSVDLPDFSLAQAVVDVISGSEAAEYHWPILRSRGQHYGSAVRLRLERNVFVPAIDYVRAQRIRQQMIFEVRRAFSRIDALILSAHPSGAYPIGSRSVSIHGRDVEVASLNSRYTRLFNLTGEPAIVLPCGLTPEGLPIGLQVVGRVWDENTMFRVARAFEREYTWDPYAALVVATAASRDSSARR